MYSSAHSLSISGCSGSCSLPCHLALCCVLHSVVSCSLLCLAFYLFILLSAVSCFMSCHLAFCCLTLCFVLPSVVSCTLCLAFCCVLFSVVFCSQCLVLLSCCGVCKKKLDLNFVQWVKRNLKKSFCFHKNQWNYILHSVLLI